MAYAPTSASSSGMSRSAFYRAIQRGDYHRIGRGIYLPADAPPADWDELEATTLRPEATICLASALARHDLTDEIPRSLDIALYRGGRKPASTGSISWHGFARESFNIGRDQVPIAGSGATIGLYSPERSIADAYRLRGMVGYEIARDALREWLRRGGKPADLLDIASQLPRARGPIVAALDVLA